jgi:hypothetical protein
MVFAGLFSALVKIVDTGPGPVPTSATIEYLVVGGGGQGSYGYCGGGGAGGMLTSNLTITTSGYSATITVGAGGVNSSNTDNTQGGISGGDSVFSDSSNVTFTSSNASASSYGTYQSTAYTADLAFNSNDAQQDSWISLWSSIPNAYDQSSPFAYTGNNSTTVDGTAIAGEWLQMDFGSGNIKYISKHTIATYNDWDSVNTGYMPDFMIAGSTDGTTWTEIGRYDQSQINKSSSLSYFSVEFDSETLVGSRYIRLIGIRVDTNMAIREWQMKETFTAEGGGGGSRLNPESTAHAAKDGGSGGGGGPQRSDQTNYLQYVVGGQGTQGFAGGDGNITTYNIGAYDPEYRAGGGGGGAGGAGVGGGSSSGTAATSNSGYGGAGGPAKQWSVDGNYYAAGGGGATRIDGSPSNEQGGSGGGYTDANGNFEMLGGHGSPTTAGGSLQDATSGVANTGSGGGGGWTYNSTQATGADGVVKIWLPFTYTYDSSHLSSTTGNITGASANLTYNGTPGILVTFTGAGSTTWTPTF